jgi:hypothetical protein
MAVVLMLANRPVRGQDVIKGSPVTLEQAVHTALEQNPAFRTKVST